ncbi:translation initiation factor IF-2 [Cytophaga aurantiaca]|uniref:translation initiation factor IF-2 n=1 Tax=Cytophaga aurantiaca TaxID=29530 RepID=UPI00035EF9ED|nr:translation initiation factor IF-2 [Cytophaga aurantiaca]
MAEEKMMRLSQVARNLNVGTSTIIDHLSAKGYEIENNPNAKITMDMYGILSKEYASSAQVKKEAESLNIGKKHMGDVVIDAGQVNIAPEHEEEDEIRIVNSNPVEVPAQETPVAVPVAEETPKVESKVSAQDDSKTTLQGLKVLGKIDLSTADKDSKKPANTAKPAEKAKSEKPAEKAKPAAKAGAQTEAPKTKAPKTEPAKQADSKIEAAKESPSEVAAPKTPVADPVEAVASPVEDKPSVAEIPVKLVQAHADKLQGLTVLGKIQLPDKKKEPTRVASSDEVVDKNKNKRKRKRLNDGPPGKPVGTNPNGPRPAGGNPNGPRPAGGPNGPRPQGSNPNGPRPAGGPNRPGAPARPNSNGPRPTLTKASEKGEVTGKQIQEKIKATMAKLSGGGNSKSGPVNRAKYRKDKRSAMADAEEERLMAEQEDAKALKVTEFISASDLASLMNVSVNEVISKCMMMGMFVSINQRLDAEAITIIADEFGYDVNFQTTGEEDDITVDDQDDPESLIERAPIVTIMGHVDHGKTSLLDYIRKSKVVAGEAGGITQHIGAYNVVTDSGKPITFLDTPGHEAFTAMRARGAKITDIVIIVVAADDSVMPQTKEAINHARVAGVPIIIAINKIDKPAANPDKIKEELSKENILVEDWGGKYQCQPISAKAGTGISELLDKVLLEAEMLELKANPNKRAVGAVIEASLDKGRGYVTNVLVESGTLRIGDIILAGAHFGRVKAMVDHTGKKLKEAGPAMPLQVLGLNGAPQAGDKFQIMETEREAREISSRREQLLREQSIRTKKHITLDEIGRRLAIGNFKELNIIVKADVDGSVEALSDSLLKLSTEEIQIRILHKGVGQISESDILLASASDAIIVAFQVRPSTSARKLAEQEQIEIRMYSIIYDAINEVKDAMEGMLEPKLEEVIHGTIDVRDVFKITKVGTVAGAYVTEGFVKRNHRVRLIRDGIVMYTGTISALKRFKDDVSEVKTSYECGISLKGYNDILVGDQIEAFEEKEVKRTL